MSVVVVFFFPVDQLQKQTNKQTNKNKNKQTNKKTKQKQKKFTEYSAILTASWFQFYIYKLLQVMHDYVHWHCSIDHCVKSSLADKP